MGNHLHPLKVMVLVAMCVVMIAGTMLLFIDLCRSVNALTTPIEYNDLGIPNWPMTIAGVIWIAAFSAGVVGCLVNLADAVRLWIVPVTNFNALSRLAKEDFRELDGWLNSHTYENDNLKELWGYGDE